MRRPEGVRPKGTRSAGETFGDEPLGGADVIVAVIITGSARQIAPPRDDIHGFNPATLAGAIGIGGTETSGSSLIAEPIAFPAVYGEIVRLVVNHVIAIGEFRHLDPHHDAVHQATAALLHAVMRPSFTRSQPISVLATFQAGSLV